MSSSSGQIILRKGNRVLIQMNEMLALIQLTRLDRAAMENPKNCIRTQLMSHLLYEGQDTARMCVNPNPSRKKTRFPVRSNRRQTINSHEPHRRPHDVSQAHGIRRLLLPLRQRKSRCLVYFLKFCK